MELLNPSVQAKSNSELFLRVESRVGLGSGVVVVDIEVTRSIRSLLGCAGTIILIKFSSKVHELKNIFDATSIF